MLLKYQFDLTLIHTLYINSYEKIVIYLLFIDLYVFIRFLFLLTDSWDDHSTI